MFLRMESSWVDNGFDSMLDIEESWLKDVLSFVSRQWLR